MGAFFGCWRQSSVKRWAKRCKMSGVVVLPALLFALVAGTHGILSSYDAETIDEGEETVLVYIVGTRIASAELRNPTADVTLLT